ncbi:MAG: HAMP domain-containing sensor histidine kinase [Methanomicrobiaceae archaeon]|nr:HAMP domain-containing sensor histidine kinase [Methanomicrobiaceae archaeon]
MKQPSKNLSRYFSVSRYLMVSILAIIIIIISVFSAFSYFGAKENLVSKNQALQQETEKSIVQSVILADRGMQLFDATFDAKMERGFDDFIAEYERCQGNPEGMNLERLKQQLEAKNEGSFDLYIINAEGVVEYTTCAHDRGLDFKQWPEVYQSITALREGDAFSADRIVYGFNPAGELRKFAYMPTGDHRYLLELSLTSDSFEPERLAISFAQISEDLVDLNPNLLSIVFYDSTGKTTHVSQKKGEKGYQWDPAVREHVVDVYENKTSLEVQDEEHEILVRYLYIDLSGGDYVSSSQMSLVAQLVYDMGLQHAEINQIFVSHLMITMLAIVTGIFVAFGSSRYISRPINEIVEDTTIIAEGDLDHSIRPTKGLEFEKLERGINTMVARLKDTVHRLKESEDRIKEYTGHLEDMVAERTADLQKSNEEMNLYLNILSHDVRVSQTITASYLALLKKSLSGKDEHVADHALKELESCIDVIHNVDLIRSIFAEESILLPVLLDDVIERSVHRHPDLQMHATPGGAIVLADDLLIEVFNAIIELIAKHAGREVAIEITSREKDGWCEVSISENGPYLPEFMQEHPHHHFGTGHMHLSGRALGSSIARLLVARYGGTIRTEERIQGQPSEGMTVIFTLSTAHIEPDAHEGPKTG